MKSPLVNWQSVLATEGAAHWNGRSQEKEEGKRSSSSSSFPFYSSSGTGREYQQATSFPPLHGWLASRSVRSGGGGRGRGVMHVITVRSVAQEEGGAI